MTSVHPGRSLPARLPGEVRPAHRPTRVAVVHGQALVCAGLAALLRDEPGLVLAGTFTAVRDLAGALTSGEADVVLLGDVDAGQGAALDAIASAHPRARVLLLVVPGRTDGVVEALRCGAWGALPMSASPQLLVKSLRTAAAGEAWVDRQTVTRLLQHLQHAAPGLRPTTGSLTRREMDIVRVVAGGASNRDVGIELGMSAQTVKNHLSTIYDKLGVSSRLELAVYALHHGLSAGSLGST